MRRLFPLVALLALLTAACRIQANVGADINADGSGVIRTEIGYDEEAAQLLGQFTEEGQDPFGEDNPLADYPGVQMTEEDRDGLHFRVYTAPVDDVAAAIEQQMAADGQGAIQEFSLTITEEKVEVTGSGSAGAIADDAGGMLSPEQLAEAFSVNLRLTLPGRILEHNADSQEGNTLTWAIPVTGGTIDIHAVSDPRQSPEGGGGFPLWAIITIAAVVVAGIASVAIIGRRRGATAPPPPPPPELPLA